MPRSVLAMTSRGVLIVALLVAGSHSALAQRGGGGGGRGQGGGGVQRRSAIRRPASPFAIKATHHRCGECHLRDSSGYMQRISYERKTPEGWEMSVRRMVALNNVTLDPATARTIVRYLSDQPGSRPGRNAAGTLRDRAAHDRVSLHGRSRAPKTTCRACHSMGRVITQRRTRGEWELLVATHRGALSRMPTSRRSGAAVRRRTTAACRNPHPMDVAITHLARVFPLRTPEWTAWSATMRPPHLEGTWLLIGQRAGTRRLLWTTDGHARGRPTASSSRRRPIATPTAARSVQRTGQFDRLHGLPVARSLDRTGARAASDTVGLREVMFVEPGWEEMSGRWFTGGYEEIGMDVSLKKLGANPVIAGVAPRALRVGTRGQDVTIFGANLPRTLRGVGVDFGPGVTVESVVRATPDSITRARERRLDGVGRQARFVRRRRVAARRARWCSTRSIASRSCRSPGWRASAASSSRNSSSSSTRSRTTTGPTASRTPTTTSRSDA